MSSFTTQTTADRRHLYRLTNGILNTHSLHFITISLLFLPLTFFASKVVQFYYSSSSSGTGTDVTTMFDPFNLILIKTIFAYSQNLLHVKTIIIILTFGSFVILPTVASVALITFSTNQIIHRQPITFSSTVKSLSHSYIPLLHTFIVGTIKLIGLFLAFTLLPLGITEAIKALEFHFLSPNFINSILSVFLNTISSYSLLFTMIFFVTVWGSAPAITLLESKSGFATLRQSANQSTEFRHHSFSIVLVAGFGVGTALAYSTLPQNSGPAANWFLILQVGVMSLQSSLWILLYVVANTVLYVQYKVASGKEIGMMTVEGKVSSEYVTLVVNDNDNEVVHELAKEETHGGFTYMLCLLAMVSVILLYVQLYNLRYV